MTSTTTATARHGDGRSPEQIKRLWRAFHVAIEAAYKAKGHEDAGILRDYCGQGWRNSLETLVKAESVDERQHRGMAPASVGRPRISAEQAAKLLILHNAATGARAESMPSAVDFLMYRRTAVEAQVLGWLIREHISPEWVAECMNLDYATAIQRSA